MTDLDNALYLSLVKIRAVERDGAVSATVHQVAAPDLHESWHVQVRRRLRRRMKMTTTSTSTGGSALHSYLLQTDYNGIIQTKAKLGMGNALYIR